jgi:hypothetical protein
MKFPALEEPAVRYGSPLYRAQRFLSTAYDSVFGLFETSYPAVRALRKGTRGRLPETEHDLFRAAVVFVGAGIDTVFKQALRSCVAMQIDQSTGARDKYIEFVSRYIQNGPSVDPQRLAMLLTAGSSDFVLKDAYIEQLTGSSLQSVNQVTSALSALGLNDHTKLYKDSKALQPLFKARNEIAHELDMTPGSVSGRGARQRRERAMSSYTSMCHEGLNFSQQVLNVLELEVNPSRGAR